MDYVYTTPDRSENGAKSITRLLCTGADFFQNVTFAAAKRPHFLNVVERKRSASWRCLNTLPRKYFAALSIPLRYHAWLVVALIQNSEQFSNNLSTTTFFTLGGIIFIAFTTHDCTYRRQAMCQQEMAQFPGNMQFTYVDDEERLCVNAYYETVPEFKRTSTNDVEICRLFFSPELCERSIRQLRSKRLRIKD